MSFDEIKHLFVPHLLKSYELLPENVGEREKSIDFYSHSICFFFLLRCNALINIM